MYKRERDKEKAIITTGRLLTVVISIDEFLNGIIKVY